MTKKVVDNDHGYEVELVADSISEDGQRISTFVLTYWRAIHGELMTHRLFSRNAMSSRAVPVQKMISHIEEKPAMPLHWGKNQPGMQANEEHDEMVHVDLSWLLDGFGYSLDKKSAWKEAMKLAVSVADGFARAGYHKQIVNRLLEPFQMMRTVVTATEFDNWYWLRDHADAQPEIKHLVGMMLGVHNQSTPRQLHHTEWHTPFYGEGVWSCHYTDEDDIEFDKHGVTLEDALKISASCAAQASFRKADETIDKARNIYQRLVDSAPVHASPFEHQAKPIEFDSFDLGVDNEPLLYDMPEGVTHMDRKGFMWSGNFKGWVQNRQLIDNNTCWDYDQLEIS